MRRAPEDLLEQYNLSLVQKLLFRAAGLEIQRCRIEQDRRLLEVCSRGLSHTTDFDIWQNRNRHIVIAETADRFQRLIAADAQ